MDKRITLEQRISRLEKLFRVKNEAADEAELVYQDDLWDVYKIMTRKAAKKYGAGTKWYLLDIDDFGDYVFDATASACDIYFYIKKKGRAKYYLCKKKGGKKVVGIVGKGDEEFKPKEILLYEPDFPSVPGVFTPPAANNNVKDAKKLSDAAADGNVDAINKLISKGVDVDAKNLSDTTALYVAVMWNRVDAAKALLEFGADPTLVCGSGVFKSTPIDKAKLDKRPALVKLLQRYVR